MLPSCENLTCLAGMNDDFACAPSILFFCDNMTKPDIVLHFDKFLDQQTHAATVGTTLAKRGGGE